MGTITSREIQRRCLHGDTTGISLAKSLMTLIVAGFPSQYGALDFGRGLVPEAFFGSSSQEYGLPLYLVKILGQPYLVGKALSLTAPERKIPKTVSGVCLS